MLALATLPLVACGGERPALPVATVEQKAAGEAVTVRHTLAHIGTVEAIPTSVPIAPMTTLSGATAQAVPAEWPAQLTEAQMELVLSLAGWPEALWAEAKAVACGIGNARWPYGESNCHPGSVGDGGNSLGLFQLNGDTWAPYCGLTRDELMEPVSNATCALAVYRYDIARGQAAWHQWSVKPW